MSAATILVEFVSQRLERLSRSYEKWSAGGDVDAVHDFRVSSRRLNEPLGIISNWVSARKVKSFRKSLRKLRRALRRVRDYDVLLESLAGSTGATQLTTEGLAQLEGILTSRRKRCFDRARSKVEALQPARVRLGVEKLIRAFEQEAGEGDGAAVLEVVGRTWRRRAAAVLREAPTSGEPRDLHPLRINFKKLRYCSELLYELEQRSQDAFLGRCREVQDRLGAWNDHLFATRLCSRLATRESLLAGQTSWCTSVLDYALSRARQAQVQREELIRFWPIAQAAIESLLPTNGSPSRAAEALSAQGHVPLPRMEESAP